MKLNKSLIIFSAIILLSSCIPETENKSLTYQNIVILADMSNRITNSKFPNKDCNEIHKIVEYFRLECVKPGEKIGDKSSITFSVFSEKNATSVDLDKIKNLADKQSFINSTNKYKDIGLAHELVIFEDTVKSLYSRIKNPGLDLISILIEKIENENIAKSNRVITDGIDSTLINYDNHVYIFTDGYLEYASTEKRQNSQFYFGNSEIESVRKYCIDNHLDIVSAIEREKSLCLPISKNSKNQYINLHILETHERDKDMKFMTYKFHQGLRDNEILEAVWRKWAKESGFKTFEWKKF